MKTWKEFKEHIESLEEFDENMPVAFRADEHDHVCPTNNLKKYDIHETVLVMVDGYFQPEQEYQLKAEHERHQKFCKECDIIHDVPLIEETGRMIIL